MRKPKLSDRFTSFKAVDKDDIHKNTGGVNACYQGCQSGAYYACEGGGEYGMPEGTCIVETLETCAELCSL